MTGRVTACCGEPEKQGEFNITETGIEGGLIYALSAPLRDALDAGPVTLVYGARDTVHNQAVALRDYLLAHPRRTA